MSVPDSSPSSVPAPAMTQQGAPHADGTGGVSGAAGAAPSGGPRRGRSLFDRAILGRAAVDAVRKLDPPDRCPHRRRARADLPGPDELADEDGRILQSDPSVGYRLAVADG